MKICPHCRSNLAVLAGIRKTKLGEVQRYLCKNCGRRFSDKLLSKKYSQNVMLSAITTFNLGYTLGETNKLINKRFGLKLPESTIYSWIKSYASICTFAKLRKRFELNPEELIKTKRLEHGQLYSFRFHSLKLNLLTKRFPSLKRYIWQVYNSCPDFLFKGEGPRCSTFKIQLPKARKVEKENNALQLAKLGALLAKTRKERHERIEEFMLINDSATIAAELPVWLYPSELRALNLLPNANKSLTGHIDILQIRGNKIHVLDYKSEISNDDATQTFLYALALSLRTKIPLNKLACAYFNEENYFEFRPKLKVYVTG